MLFVEVKQYVLYVAHTVRVFKSVYQSTNARNKIQFMTSIKLLQVSAAGYRPKGVF